MKNNLTDEQKDELKKIENKINELKSHRGMWAKAGGVGGRMALQAMSEIELLEIKRDDIINGTNKYEILLKEKEIKSLKLLREEATFLKRRKYSKQIKQSEEELENLKTKR